MNSLKIKMYFGYVGPTPRFWHLTDDIYALETAEVNDGGFNNILAPKFTNSLFFSSWTFVVKTEDDHQQST